MRKLRFKTSKWFSQDQTANSVRNAQLQQSDLEPHPSNHCPCCPRVSFRASFSFAHPFKCQCSLPSSPQVSAHLTSLPLWLIISRHGTFNWQLLHWWILWLPPIVAALMALTLSTAFLASRCLCKLQRRLDPAPTLAPETESWLV